jgi:hypothetical protein
VTPAEHVHCRARSEQQARDTAARYGASENTIRPPGCHDAVLTTSGSAVAPQSWVRRPRRPSSPVKSLLTDVRQGQILGGVGGGDSAGRPEACRSNRLEVVCAACGLGQEEFQLGVYSASSADRICETVATRGRWGDPVPVIASGGIGAAGDGTGESIVTCAFETDCVGGDGDWLAHNPEVAGSNPVPATW